jgi:hypothetical protein
MPQSFDESRSRAATMTLTRRGLLASAALAVAGASGASLYGRLVVGERFENLVASRLGVEHATADALLGALRAQLGDREYDFRAAGFAVAIREPVASAIPADLRREAIEGFVRPLLARPAALNAYAAGRGDPAGRGCAGLVLPA